MTETTTPIHWTQFPGSAETVRTIECDAWDTIEDGQFIPAGFWKMFEDFVFVGCTRDVAAAETWRDAKVATAA